VSSSRRSRCLRTFLEKILYAVVNHCSVLLIGERSVCLESRVSEEERLCMGPQRHKQCPRVCVFAISFIVAESSWELDCGSKCRARSFTCEAGEQASRRNRARRIFSSSIISRAVLVVRAPVCCRVFAPYHSARIDTLA